MKKNKLLLLIVSTFFLAASFLFIATSPVLGQCPSSCQLLGCAGWGESSCTCSTCCSKTVCSGGTCCVYECPAGSCECFTGETKIAAVETKKRIEILGKGEVVASFDPEAGEIKEGTVLEVAKTTREGFWQLETENGRKVRVTGEHPFLAIKTERSQLTIIEHQFLKMVPIFSKLITFQEEVALSDLGLKKALFIPVSGLKKDDWVFVRGEGGLVAEQITKLEYYQEEVEVYNLSVEGEETFFANGFAVHNKAGIDNTKPQCRVIVNPTISGENIKVKNRSFENPNCTLSPKGRWRCPDGNFCPRFWYNREDANWWCDVGLEVENGAPCGGCGDQHVGVEYPFFQARQYLEDLESLNSQPGKVLYRVSAFGKGSSATINFKEKVDDGYGTFAFLCPGCSANQWGHGKLLGWTYNASQPVILNCFKCDEDSGGTDFDYVSLEKLVGTTETASLEVDLYVAYYDNRNVGWLRHWNQGENPPDWDSEDPRVIPFGPYSQSRADPIDHTLAGFGSQTINVQVRDWAGNVSDFCSAKVNSVAPEGMINGTVYDITQSGQSCPLSGPTQSGGIIQIAGYGTRTPDPDYAFDDLPAGTPHTVVMTDFPSGFSSPFYCDGEANNTNQVTLDGEGDVKTVNIGLTRLGDPWFQTIGGDVHAQGNLNDPIPLGATEGSYCSLKGEGNYPGVVSYGGGISLGDGSASEEPFEWLANSSSQGSWYAYFEALVDDYQEETPSLIDGKPAEGFYKLTGDQTIDDDWVVVGDEKLVILVTGNLSIEADITVIKGGFLGLIVEGDITIDSGVTTLEGVFVGGSFNVASRGDPSEVQLVAEGSFVGGDIILERDFTDERNNTDPAEVFAFRPDLWLNAPRYLWEVTYTWQELTP